MNDQDEGMGGSYVIDADGARKLLERTGPPGQSAVLDQPASAVFFMPVIPVAPADTTTPTE